MSVLVDANLLVYAALPSAPQHAATRAWLEAQFSDPSITVGLTWPALYGFMRLIANPAVVGSGAIGPAGAWQAAQIYWLQPNARIVAAGDAHRIIAAELVSVPGLRANDLPDVLLAATAIEHGLELCSHDSGFARFPGLRWSDPLASAGG